MAITVTDEEMSKKDKNLKDHDRFHHFRQQIQVLGKELDEIISKLKTDHQKETFKEILAVFNQESNISEQLSKFDKHQNSLIFKKMNLYSDISLDEFTDVSSGSMNKCGILFLDTFVDILQTEEPNWSIPKFTESNNELDLEQLLNQVKAKNKLMGDISLALNKLLDKVSWLFLSIVCTLLLCLFLSSCIMKGHKSAMLKKYLVLKYACYNAILYLLWCSGDVELHPGPTFKRPRKLANSEKKRNWIHDMCSVLLKVIIGVDPRAKRDGIWKEENKPNNWPDNKPFYDPKNKQTGKNYNSETDEELLQNLLNCCQSSSLEIPKEYQNEVNAWEEPGGDKKKLYDLFIIRTEFCSLSKVVLEISCYCKFMQSHGFEVTFSSLQTGSEPTKHVNDIVRDLIVTLCKLAKNLNPVEKHDGIWKEPPEGWNPDNKFYDPCNAGKRSSTNEDQNLLTNLIDYCEEKMITIPEDLIPILDAWKNRNKRDLCKFYTIWANCLQIHHSLEYLEIEELLHQPLVQQKLDALGIHKLQSDRPLKRRGDGKDKTISKRQALETRDKPVVASSSQAKPTTESKVVDEPVDSQGLSTNTDVFLDISNQHTPSFQANEMPDSRIEEQTFEPFQGTPIINDVFMGSPLKYPTNSASSTIAQDMFISSAIDNPLDEVEVCSDFEQLLPIHEKLFPWQI